MSLENLYAYVYPPIYPILKILQYIRQFHCQIIIILLSGEEDIGTQSYYNSDFSTSQYINSRRLATSTKNTDLSPTTSDFQSGCFIAIDRSIKTKGVYEKAHTKLL